MRESRPTLGPVTLDFTRQQFAARLEHPCSSNVKELHIIFYSGALICRVSRKQHEHGQTTEGMNWPAPGNEPLLRTTILDSTTAAKMAAQHWAREKQGTIGARVWRWWPNGLRSDDARCGTNHG